ncbi:cell wall hydrolase [Caenispirillum bisanense]|uniref:Cell Wall Hydrolase n=1 Tax=Caenispirillum bisanense TaxID=414052 RepID=A0A286GAN6_9PROT|nr:cell wall hydrolase [Caenispirillum bisanense]SOD92548.1 Cell Wall Hydrolase [Caenispirillum bisanense]
MSGAAKTTPPVPPLPADLLADPVEVLARTLWGEARGEPVRGQEAVAAVVLNRVARAQARGGRWWWGASVTEVCLKPWQFSCWNANDPNRPRLLALTPQTRGFAGALRIARRAVAGNLADPTDGATHYHARGIHPPWAWRLVPCAEIGRHLFYNDVEVL